MAQEYVSNAILLMGVVAGPLALLLTLLGFARLAMLDLQRQWVQARLLRSTPCHRCLYFSGCEELMCAVHPYRVLTQAAKDCRDFEASQISKALDCWPHKA
ncbi:MAG: hypothetical protein ACFB0C_03025 [Leptolyngbyaceae cyanobacterium]